MFKFDVNKNMKSMLHKKEGDYRKGNDTFMSNTNYPRIEN